MPLGLTDNSPREANRAARAFLVGKASSVFNAPARAVLVASSYVGACPRSHSPTAWSARPPSLQ